MGVSVQLRKGSADVNMVPFIDMMTVAIVFLMMCLSAHIDLLTIDQSASPAASTVATDPPLAIRLQGSGVKIGGVDVAGRDWAAIAGAIGDGTADPRVDIAADDGVPYGDVIRMLDLAKAHGYRSPRMQTVRAAQP